MLKPLATMTISLTVTTTACLQRLQPLEIHLLTHHSQRPVLLQRRTSLRQLLLPVCLPQMRLLLIRTQADCKYPLFKLSPNIHMTFEISATYYYQNGVAGACGAVHSDTDFIAAISEFLMSTVYPIPWLTITCRR